MADSLQQLEKRLWWRLTAPILAVAVLLGPAEATADIILDDFTDSAMVESPSMRNVFVSTVDVGELDARREIRIAAGGTDPIGRVNINITGEGLLSAQLAEIVRTDMLTPLSAVQFSDDRKITSRFEAKGLCCWGVLDPETSLPRRRTCIPIRPKSNRI